MFDLLTFYFNQAHVMIGWSMCNVHFTAVNLFYNCSIDCLKSKSWYFKMWHLAA